MAKMEIDEKTVDLAIKLCQDVSDKILAIRTKYYQRSKEITRQWNDEKFKEVKALIEKDFEAFEIAEKQTDATEEKLNQIKEYIKEYNEPIV